MKVKDLKTMLDQFGDEQEVTFFGHWLDGDKYEPIVVQEESPEVMPFLTDGGNVMLVPICSDTNQVKKEFKGMFLAELLTILDQVKSKKLWLKLLQEKNNEETN